MAFNQYLTAEIHCAMRRHLMAFGILKKVNVIEESYP